MNAFDLIIMGLSNLWRTRLRTFLTLSGVVIGIAALTSMVSFGSGMQKNITDAFMAGDLFTSITVTSRKIDPAAMAAGQGAAALASQTEEVPLTDSLLLVIKDIPGVELAYPNYEIQARVHLHTDSSSFSVTAVPAAIRHYRPYNDLLAGAFFETDDSRCAVIREEALLSRFSIRISENPGNIELSRADSIKGVVVMHPDSLIGMDVHLVTMTVDQAGLPAAMFGMMAGNPSLPLTEVKTTLTLCGILKTEGQFASDFARGNLFVAPETARAIPRLGFTSVWDLLNNRDREKTYGSINVRVADVSEMDGVREALDGLGVGVFSLSDQLKNIKRVFMTLNAALGAIGAIALLVAGLGITNTMVMSILERTREIGIMKAIGGSDREIRLIFFVEAAVIGMVGAIAGIGLGWMITRVAGWVVNARILPQGEAPVDIFYFPLWLIVGAILFSIGVSLLAGLYPAIRASRIDPVRALRHD